MITMTIYIQFTTVYDFVVEPKILQGVAKKRQKDQTEARIEI